MTTPPKRVLVIVLKASVAGPALAYPDGIPYVQSFELYNVAGVNLTGPFVYVITGVPDSVTVADKTGTYQDCPNIRQTPASVATAKNVLLSTPLQNAPTSTVP